MQFKFNWSESHVRSILKAISWRIWATLTTMIIGYFVTHNLSFAMTIGIFEVLSKIILFYLHERIWASGLKFGYKITRKDDLAIE